MEKKLTIPAPLSEIESLRAGDYVYLSGKIYTARDAAHKRMSEALAGGEKLPIEIKDAFIYYMGPSPTAEGHVIGSAGPTTSGRMDRYTPALLDLGLKGMIGKGRRSRAVRESIAKNKAVYLAAVGGAGALLSKSIIKSTVIAYGDLGAEAIRELEIKDFPAIVIIDSTGRDYYETAAEKYAKPPFALKESN